MSSFTPINRIPPPPRPPPPEYNLQEVEEEINVETAHRQHQTIQDWLFASVPGLRSTHILPRLHRSTIIHGLTALRQHIVDLIDLDIQLYHKSASLLSNHEYVAKAFAYAGWTWLAPPAATLEMVEREDLEKLLWQEVKIYDKIAKSVRTWKRDIDARIGQQQRNGMTRERSP